MNKSYVILMRKIVIKKTITNILLVAIVFGIIFGIMLYPLGEYLMLVGLNLRDSTLVGLCIVYPFVMILFRLAVKIEEKGEDKSENVQV